jgi:predicted N-acetyltransferase YhbS
MSATPPLRVWLEPEYDGGRFGAWCLELPGAFGWAPTRDLAISQVPSAAGWFRDWLERHGEEPGIRIGNVEIVEEVTATIVDGYERNATFGPDRAAVRPEELEAAVRRLDYARIDLLELTERIPSLEASGGRLDPETRGAATPAATDATRSGPDVLRHLAGTETWFVSRLDPAARFTDADPAGELTTYLAATRSWMLDGLRRLHRIDPGLARVDGKGENWTLRKVLRRAVYHSIDHLRELDRRLALAERRSDRLALRRERIDDVAPLARLLRSVGWDRRVEDADRLERAIGATRLMVGAWNGNELVGFARELGDGEFTAHISMVIVDPRWQGLGIAARLMGALMDGRPDVRFTLGAAGGLEGYYEKFGFESDSRAMVRRRQRG